MRAFEPSVSIALGRISRRLSELEASFNRSDINTRLALIIEVNRTLSLLRNQINSPSLQVPSFNILKGSVLSTAFDQAFEDIELAAEVTERLRIGQYNFTNYALVVLASLQARLREATALVDRFRIWVPDSVESYVWVSDTFNSSEKVHRDSVIRVDTRGGYVSLVTHTSRTVNSLISKIGLESNSGGIPGNNLEISEPGVLPFGGTRSEPQPIRYKDQHNTDRVGNIFDGNPDSWFEFERVHLKNPQPIIHAGKSLIYDPTGRPYNKIPELGGWRCYIKRPGETTIDTGVSKQGYPMVVFEQVSTRRGADGGITHPTAQAQTRHTRRRPFNNIQDEPRGTLHYGDAPLELVISIELSNLTAISWIELTPFIRSEKYPIVKQVSISATGEKWKDLLNNDITLHPRINRNVDFTRYGINSSNFEGIAVFPTPSTKIKFIRITLQQNSSYECAEGIAHEYYAKRRGRRTIAPIPVVGETSDSSLDLDSDDGFINEEARQRQRTFRGFDIFQARRFCIGIRDILLEERLYVESGVLYSTPITLDTEVKAAGLIVTENIPDTYPTDTRWINYEISTDNENWLSILPKSSGADSSVVNFPNSTKSLYFRAKFSRPADQPNTSPLLLAYALQLLPA